MSHWILGFLASAALMGANAAEATTVVFDNFGPGDTYNSGGGYNLGTDGEWDQGDALAVSPTESVYLETIELAVALVDGSDELDVWLMADAGGEPGGIIESFHFSGAMGPWPNTDPPMVAVSALRPVLTAGQQYWVIGSAPEDDTWAAWNWNSIDDLGPHAWRHPAAAPWSVADRTRGALRVTGTAIPEPSTLALVSLGGVGAFRAWRRRRA